MLKDWSYIIQFSNISLNGDKIEDLSARWIDTIKNCITQQTEQRRG